MTADMLRLSHVVHDIEQHKQSLRFVKLVAKIEVLTPYLIIFRNNIL